MTEKTLFVRPAGAADAARLQQLDTVALTDPFRREQIGLWIKRDTVLVAEVDGSIEGYLVLNQAFFDRPQIQMLMVADRHRRKGIGSALLLEAERHSSGEKLFATTNQSNVAMQSLLLKNMYRVCGFIEELDPGDPELVFYKSMLREAAGSNP